MNAILLTGSLFLFSNAFVTFPSYGVASSKIYSAVAENDIDPRTGKKTGNAFLSKEVKERALVGNPIEKIKQEKDGTSAFVDVYEYARKIRDGELTWEEVEKADLDTVSESEECQMITI